jgi:hypothetical protein
METDLFSFSRSIIVPLLRKHMPAIGCIMTHGGSQQHHVHGMQVFFPKKKKKLVWWEGWRHYISDGGRRTFYGYERSQAVPQVLGVSVGE